MVSELFLRVSLLGAEWVLYLLVLISVGSLALILERWIFYRQATAGLAGFRTSVRAAAQSGDWAQAAKLAEERANAQKGYGPDFETDLTAQLARAAREGKSSVTAEMLQELAADSLLRTRLQWDRFLAVLATIGSNAPFVGLFGTVLGIIQAFHELSKQAQGGGLASTVTAGISEALVATAFGILVAIPAVVAFNLFQRRVRAASTEADSLRAYLTGRILGGTGR